jgi:ankyrin repeat protein
VSNADSRGATSLHRAIINHHTALMQLLLEHGATAVMNNVVPIRCPQFTKGTDCWCTDVTSLMMCTTVDTVKVLLAAGADVHIRNSSGDTCLHAAVRHKLTAPVLCLLIKAGADIHAVNSSGKTAAQIAHEMRYTLVEQLLNRAAQ